MPFVVFFPCSSIVFCLLLWISFGFTDQKAEANFQAITNLTMPSNGLVSYQIQTFTIDDHPGGEISLVIQQNDAVLVHDMAVCANFAYTIDPTKIYVQTLDPNLFNMIGLYEPKVLHQLGDQVIHGKMSIAYDWKSRQLFYTHLAQIKVLELCYPSNSAKIVIRSNENFQLSNIAVDPVRDVLCWVESLDIDQYRIMRSTTRGEQVNILHQSNSGQCNAMTIDIQTGVLYWVQQQKLWSVSYHTLLNDARIVLENDNLITDTIQVNRQFIYWSSMQRKILRMPIPFDQTNQLLSERGKVQLISQLGSQHLLLVTFKVNFQRMNLSNETTTTTANFTNENIEKYCTPQCVASQSNPLDDFNEDKDYIYSEQVTDSVWAELRKYDWTSPKHVARMIIISLIIIVINTSLLMLYTCLRPHHSKWI